MNASAGAAARRALLPNTLWNLGGAVVPLGVAFFALPPLLSALGIERFGMLSLIWMLTGYFGLLDLGLGRALTKLVAERVEAPGRAGLARLVWTGLVLMTAFGAAGSVILAIAAGPLVRVVLNVPPALQDEAVGAAWFLALSLPVTIAATGLRGVMEGLHLFKAANLLRIPLAVLTLLAPLAVSVITPDLAAVSASLFVVRSAGLAAHWLACVRAAPGLARFEAPDRSLFRPLLGFGGWLTVSNVVGPLMTYLDRFVIGGVATLAAVAYYTTPYEVVTKLLIIPFSLTAVLFPTFSVIVARRGPEAGILMVRSLGAVFAVLLPAAAVIVAFAREGLGLWLGDDFASHSYRVLQWLAAGVLVNSMAQVPFTLVQGAGRADWVAKLHLAELPLYLAALWWLLKIAGIEGAAIAWTARVTADGLALLWLARRAAPERVRFPGGLAFAITAGIAGLIPLAVIESTTARGAVATVGTAMLSALVWRRYVRPRLPATAA